jgi:hypothetical protein
LHDERRHQDAREAWKTAQRFYKSGFKFMKQAKTAPEELPGK